LRVKILAQKEGQYFSRGKKEEAPMPLVARGLRFVLCLDARSTARSAARSATAAAAQRIGRGDGKSGSITGFNEINLHGTALFLQIGIDKKLQAAFLVHFIAIFWLIQSQAQRWATSATLHQCDANRRTDLVLLQVGFQIVDSYCCCFEHSASSKVMNASSPREKKGLGYGAKVRRKEVDVNLRYGGRGRVPRKTAIIRS